MVGQFWRASCCCARARFSKWRNRILKIIGSRCGCTSSIQDFQDHPALQALVRIDEMQTSSKDSMADVGCLLFWALDPPDCVLPAWFGGLFKLWMGMGPYREATSETLDDVVHTIKASLARQPRMQESEALNEMLQLSRDCARLKFRPSFIGYGGPVGRVAARAQPRVADLLSRLDEEGTGCCAAAVVAFLVGFPGQGTVEVIQAFLTDNCEREEAEGLLQLAARVELLLPLQTSCDDYGAFKALSTAIRDRVLMATDTDVFVQVVVPLLFPGWNLLKVFEKSGNRIHFHLNNGKEYVWQRDRMLIKKPGARTSVYDAAARRREIEAILQPQDVANSIIQDKVHEGISFEDGYGARKSVESYV